jgi:type I restriction enzyme M protein
VFTRQDESDPRYARLVPLDVIEKNDFNLNLPRYIDSAQAEDRQDIEAHLKGGIPMADVEALAPYWAVCPQLKATLFRANRPGYVDLAVEASAVKATIHSHPVFKAFIARMNEHFASWRAQSAAVLKTLQPGFRPKELIVRMSESLLSFYQGQPLIDPYAVYQHVMDYWAATMQDDCYLIAADGWQATTYRVIETRKGKDGKPGKQVDKGWACDLVPKPLIVARYFAAEQAATDQLSAELEAVLAKIMELEEEHSGDEAVFSGFDKINAASVKERLREIGRDADAADEVAVLTEWQALVADEAALKKKLKDAEAALDAAAYAHYPQLSETEVQNLVVDDKWLTALDVAVHGEMDRVSQALTQRVKELAERYGTPLPKLVNQTNELEAAVYRHLATMGFV